MLASPGKDSQVEGAGVLSTANRQDTARCCSRFIHSGLQVELLPREQPARLLAWSVGHLSGSWGSHPFPLAVEPRASGCSLASESDSQPPSFLPFFMMEGHDGKPGLEPTQLFSRRPLVPFRDVCVRMRADPYGSNEVDALPLPGSGSSGSQSFTTLDTLGTFSWTCWGLNFGLAVCQVRAPLWSFDKAHLVEVETHFFRDGAWTLLGRSKWRE